MYMYNFIKIVLKFGILNNLFNANLRLRNSRKILLILISLDCLFLGT